MLINNMNLNKRLNIIYFIFIFIFSILINQYYGNKGICAIDSFVYFNSSYDSLNGFYPFKDYWSITGPFITFVQMFFFKIFGTSWFSYVFHASFINFILAISVFYTLYNLKLNIHYSFLYSLFVSVIAYPSSGTPYVDHHSAIFSIISLFCFILAIKKNSNFFWFLLPILLCLSFLTKQAPTGYIFLIITFLSTIYFIFNFDLKKIICGILGSILILILIILIFNIGKIPLVDFYEQYILFPLSLGESRYELLLFPIDFSEFFLRYKLIHISSITLIIVAFIKLRKNLRYLISNEFLVTISLITTSYAFIVHQMMTINGMFIFFIIPILIGFSHIYYLDNFKKNNNIINLLIILSFASTCYYGYKYIHKRDFMDLRQVDMKNTIDGKILSPKLKGLNWKSCLFYSDDPKNEISELIKIMKIIDNDKEKKSIITDYQFISVALSIYDYSPSQVWYGYHVNPQKNQKYFDIYKKFVLKILNENKIKVVYLIKPMWGGDNIFEEVIDSDCLKKEIKNNKLDKYTLLPCKDFKNL